MINTVKLSQIANIIAGQSPESVHYSDTEGTPFLQGNRTFNYKYASIDSYTKKNNQNGTQRGDYSRRIL